MKKVRRFFRHHFVPHKGNGHKPHLLRTQKALVIFALLLFLEATFLSYVFGIMPQGFLGADVMSAVLIDLANSERLASGAPSLASHPLLAKAAQLKADDMALHNYFSHESPAGLAPWHWLEKAGYSYSYAGENLAINYVDSADIQKAWMQSAEHRANILAEKYSDVGIGVAYGTYEGKPAVFIVQFFGTQAPAVARDVTPVKTQAIKPVQIPKASVKIESEPIEAAQAKAIQAAAIFEPERLLASPQQTVSYAYEAAALIILAALGVLVAYQRKKMHPELLRNGLLLASFLLLLLVGNWYLFTYSGSLASGLMQGAVAEARI